MTEHISAEELEWMAQKICQEEHIVPPPSAFHPELLDLVDELVSWRGAKVHPRDDEDDGV